MNKNLKVKFSKEIKDIEDKNSRPNLDLKYTCRPHKSILKNRKRIPRETYRYYNGPMIYGPVICECVIS